MELKTTRYEVAEGGVAVLTLARPKRRNAWTGRMHTEYRSLLAQADADPAVRVIVVTGDPEGQAFCAGADLQALEGHAQKGGYDPGTPDDIARPGYGVDPAFDASFAYHFGLAKPVSLSLLVQALPSCWRAMPRLRESSRRPCSSSYMRFPRHAGHHRRADGDPGAIAPRQSVRPRRQP